MVSNKCTPASSQKSGWSLVGIPLVLIHTLEKTCKHQKKLDKQELRKPKHAQECDLAERRVNMLNHCLCHKCCGYCLNQKQMTTIFKANKHGDVPSKLIFSRSNGTEMVFTVYKEYRMGFVTPFEYDHSGQKNLTRGKDRVVSLTLLWETTAWVKWMHDKIIQDLFKDRLLVFLMVLIPTLRFSWTTT